MGQPIEPTSADEVLDFPINDRAAWNASMRKAQERSKSSPLYFVEYVPLVHAEGIVPGSLRAARWLAEELGASLGTTYEVRQAAIMHDDCTLRLCFIATDAIDGIEGIDPPEQFVCHSVKLRAGVN
jgi:hypothetical protein